MTFLDKRYQVFVSSTYKDLIEERQEVMHALLELDCIPAGMELFPAANEDQWTLIKGVINDCDYYIVIIGGRYGSMDEDGISYTEREYNYALEIGKPIIGFIHEKPDEIPAGKTDQSDEKRQKLERFKELIEKKIVKYWSDGKDLGSKVSRSIIRLIKNNPAVGWVRADKVPSENVSEQILKLKNEIENLQQELENTRTEPPKDIEKYAHGNEFFKVKYNFDAREKGDYYKNSWISSIDLTWDEIYSILSPLMISENSEKKLRDRISEHIRDIEYKQKSKDFISPYNFKITNESFESIIVQFLTIGLIKKSSRRHTASDTNIYWSLTEYGEYIMMNLRAIGSVYHFDNNFSETERDVMISIQKRLFEIIPKVPDIEFGDFGYSGNKTIGALSISSKDLINLSNNIGDLENLESLYITNSKLFYLPDSITKLKKLVVLWLSENFIEVLPKDISKLKNLEILILSKNKLKSIPNDIGLMENLFELFLNNNNLENLPDTIADMEKLEYLDLENNEIEFLPNWSQDINYNLYELNLNGNKLKAIPESLKFLTNLQHLYLERNILSIFPEVIKHLKNLQILSLTSNYLEILPEYIKNLDNLEELNLNSNKITTLPKFFGDLKLLKNLRIEDNLIIEYPEELWNLKNLKYLGLGNNEMQELPKGVGMLTSLEEIYIVGEKIKFLPDFISKLKELKIINLQDTKIDILPDFLLDLENLNKIYINIDLEIEIKKTSKKLIDKLVKKGCELIFE